MRRLKADRVMWRSVANNEKLPVRATLGKSSSHWASTCRHPSAAWVRQVVVIANSHCAKVPTAGNGAALCGTAKW